MMAPGEFVISSWLGELTMLTCPATICEPVGLARTFPAKPQANATATAMADTLASGLTGRLQGRGPLLPGLEQVEITALLLVMINARTQAINRQPQAGHA